MRYRGEFSDRSMVYIQGVVSPNEALVMAFTLGSLVLLQRYSDGERVGIWDNVDGFKKGVDLRRSKGT